MSKLIIKMVYNPNISRYSQSISPNFSSNSQVQVTKVRNSQNQTSTSNLALWQDDYEDFNIPTLLIGIVPFIIGLVLFIWSLLLPEISAYREIFILLIFGGWIILNPKLGLKQNDKISVGN